MAPLLMNGEAIVVGKKRLFMDLTMLSFLTRTYVSINVTECPNPRKHIETKLVILDQPTKY